MVRYSVEPDNEEKTALTRGSSLRVHFKHCREVGHAIKGKNLQAAKSYLQGVLKHERAVPLLRYKGSRARHGVGAVEKAPGSIVAFPTKAVNIFLDLLTNAEANAESKGLDTANVTIAHVQVNQAPKTRRRTFRAHGRIGAYMGHPCHIELMLTEKSAEVAKASTAVVPRLTAKRLAQLRVTNGGGH